MVREQNITTFDVAIVGGGITGMYCSLRLAEKGLKVGLFEMADRWGGRIETVRMGKNKNFVAEFGPMRYERKGQKLLMGLLDELGVERTAFPSFQSANPGWVKFKIEDKEEQRWQDDPVNLMLMGMLKVLGKYQNGMSKDEMREEVKKLGNSKEDYDRLRKEARQNGKPDGELLYKCGLWNALSDVMSHQAILKVREFGNFYHLLTENPNAIEWIIWWLRSLQPDDYLVGIKNGSSNLTEAMVEKLNSFENLTAKQKHKLTSLHSEGDRVRLCFEGETKEVLAKEVILAMPQYPLQRLSKYLPEIIEQDLETVIPKPLLKAFFVTDDPWWDEDITPQTGADIIPTRELHYFLECCFQLNQDKTEQYKQELDRGELSQEMREEFHHNNYELPEEMEVKTKDNGSGWVICDRTSDGKTHSYYISSDTFFVYNRNGQGMVMVYTDRPASEYWDCYVCNQQNHDRAELNRDKRLAEKFCRFILAPIKEKIISNGEAKDTVSQPISDEQQELIKNIFPAYQKRCENRSPHNPADVIKDLEKLEDSIAEYGIRAWGLKPYGAGAHAWQPEVKSWEVIERLQAFSLPDDKNDRQNVHICGEAYSDYQGFIEGSLRTAEGVLEVIDRSFKATREKATIS